MVEERGGLDAEDGGSARSPLRGMSEVAVLGYLKAALRKKEQTEKAERAPPPYKKTAAEFLSMC
jgi:hypothetical protein